jgi:glycerol-3-phosphate dehydrogenase
MGGVITNDAALVSRSSWDLIVVGGGVYGVCTALEAARRGLRPLLLERGDFGGETTWNSLRIVHGGLRYLQSLDIPRFRESVAERRWFLQHFPDLVEPLACLMPLYGDGLRRPTVMGVALALNHLLSASRNRGVAKDRALRAGGVVGPGATRRACPEIRQDGLRGSAVWYDAVMPDSQRLLIELLRAACAMGASAVNGVDVEGVVMEGRRVSGVIGRPTGGGTQLRFESPAVVNCAGPWVRAIASGADRDIPELFHPSLAFNLLLNRPPLATSAVAVAPPRDGARTYFLTGWKGHLFAGTYHAPCEQQAPFRAPTAGQVSELLADLNDAVPSLELLASDVLRVHWGLLPAREPGSADLAVRPSIHHHAATGGPAGLVSVSGVKWTTARKVAAATIDSIAPRRPVAALRRDIVPQPPPWPEYRELALSDPGAARAILDRIVSDEAPRTTDDIVLRRTDWGSVPVHAEEARTTVVRLLGRDCLPHDSGE